MKNGKRKFPGFVLNDTKNSQAFWSSLMISVPLKNSTRKLMIGMKAGARIKSQNVKVFLYLYISAETPLFICIAKFIGLVGL